MSRATALINKVDTILNSVAPPDRKAYKRVITRSGDSLIGRSTAQYADTLMSPQPYFTRLGRDRVPGGHAHFETVIDANNKAVIADDYEVIISPTAMSLDELQSKDTVIVLKDSSGNEETLRLMDFEQPGLSGTDVLYVAYMRSTKRP